jgi:hypothetical protein
MFKNLLGTKPNSSTEKINNVAKAEYLNIPVQLLSGFLDNTRLSIRNIYYYSLYAHFVKINKGSDKEKYRECCNWFNFQEVDREETLRHGKILFERFQNSPMTGIERNLYSEYNKVEKSDFDKACFLAFHSLKSIVGSKPFQKADNKFMWARMDGKVKTVSDVGELSEKLRFFTQEYQTLKIKRELQENWGLIYYAQQTRGFYFSFKMDLKSLIREAMKRKQKLLADQRLDKLRALERQVLEKLQNGRNKSV